MAGGCLGMGIVSARTQTEHDPAYALLYEYVEKVRVHLVSGEHAGMSDSRWHSAVPACGEGACAGEHAGASGCPRHRGGCQAAQLL